MHQLNFGSMALPAMAAAARLGIADLVERSPKRSMNWQTRLKRMHYPFVVCSGSSQASEFSRRTRPGNTCRPY